MAFEYGYSTAEPRTLDHLGSAVRRFRERRAGRHRPVHLVRRSKVGSPVRSHAAAAARLRRSGTRALARRASNAICSCARWNNMQVCVPTTPAQMFHMLRRQMLRNVRKPLIVMTPKSLLRHKLAVSTLDDLADGGFQLVIPDDDREAMPKKVAPRGAVLWQGLLRSRRGCRAKRKIDDVAIVRVEQLYPFPRKEVAAELARYPQREGSRLVPGRADEPGRVVLRSASSARACQAARRQEHALAGPRRPPRLAGGGLSAHLRAERRSAVRRLARARRSRKPLKRRRRDLVDANRRAAAHNRTGFVQQERSIHDDRSQSAACCRNPSPTRRSRSWHKKPGDAVKRDENLVDLETDKVVLEVPAPVDGVLKEIKSGDGRDRDEPAALAVIEEGGRRAVKADAPRRRRPRRSAATKTARSRRAAPIRRRRHRRTKPTRRRKRGRPFPAGRRVVDREQASIPRR